MEEGTSSLETPRKLITEDLVQEEYLEYHQVPSSDPPRYEFLWGPKALTENCKMKVLEFLTKVKDSVPDALLAPCEEAWREEVESTGARAAASIGLSAFARHGTCASASVGPFASASAGPSPLASAGTSASASFHSRATSSRSSCP